MIRRQNLPRQCVLAALRMFGGILVGSVLAYSSVA